MEFSSFHDTFFDEAQELLDDMEALLLGLDVERPDPETVAAIFRAAHSIKGGASTFDFTALQRTTHGLENLLDGVRQGSLALSPASIDLMLEVRDSLLGMLAFHRRGEAPDEGAMARATGLLTDLAATMPAKGSSAETVREDSAQPTDTAQHAGDTMRLAVRLQGVDDESAEGICEELGLFGELGEVSVENGVMSATLATQSSIDDISSVLCFVLEPEQISLTPVEPVEPVESIKKAPQASAPSAAAKEMPRERAAAPARRSEQSSTLRVSTEKIDQILNLVGELVITQATLEQAAASLDSRAHEDLMRGTSLLQRNVRDLQEAVMSVRMLPIDSVFNRFPRLVHDMAGKLGKQVELETRGHDVELDKGLIEGIVDPLTHLVRNSLDHGVELPEQRLADGKPECGRLLLSAAHQAGNIVIEVADDGAGLNRERILAKARSNGLEINPAMSDEAVWDLIFAPGFSTAVEVTDLSGRGVGMDVVRRNIVGMGGSVSLFSTPGQGTTTRIVLPLTLAILDGMLTEVGNETFILPLSAIAESIQLDPNSLKRLPGGGRVVPIRGDYLPLIELGGLFHVPGAERDLGKAIGVVVEADRARYVLLVDRLIGQRQVVVKSLETHYRRVPGVAAATILGDGTVALILDLPMLAALQHEGLPGDTPPAPVQAISSQPSIVSGVEI
ncbi:chemotaxis protein CheW [Halotalea alkalilenta]|uniref:chemotaxis protein CheW n=1 Tax=Halotalea alkalilenta TaxID=376489 RepID=UPI0007D0B277|nr:chemotaxis protein CheW [Halotalea alkalilenta]